MVSAGPLISLSGGIRIANRILPAEPTLSDMDSTDIGFKLLIENTLRDIKSPEHRHLVIETITIIATGMSHTMECYCKLFFSFETKSRIEVQPSGRH